MLKIIAFLNFFIFTSALFATSYVHTWVNGTQNSTVTQGDSFAWEFDVSRNGGSGQVQIIIDLDGSGTFNDGDALLIQFEQTDGLTVGDGPADSSDTPDGLVYSAIGPFGFAPEHYILIVTDSEDASEASAAFEINALSAPAATVSGNISIEGVNPPASELQNIMVLAQLDEGFAGYWSGLTNDQGNYIINIPAEGIGQQWNIELFNEADGNYLVDDHYKTVIANGANSGFNFYFGISHTYVYGRLIDDMGEDVVLDDHIVLSKDNSEDGFDADITDGHYRIPVSFDPGEDSIRVQMHLWGANLPPDYMVPDLWSDPDYQFSLFSGDSIEKNIVLPLTNAMIYVQVLMDGSEANQAFEADAYNNRAYTRSITGENGFGTLHVVDSGFYHVMLRFDNDELAPVPLGYTFEGPTNQSAQPGDTVRFSLVPAPSSISGSLIFVNDAPPSQDNFNDLRVFISDSTFSNSYDSGVSDSLNYRFELLNGKYNIWFSDYQNDYLSKPDIYQNLSVYNQHLENVDFQLNQRHAQLTVKLKNAPYDPHNVYWTIKTEGTYPDIYQTWEPGSSDSTYNFRVCDGVWQLIALWTNDSLSLDVTVNNSKTDYYIEMDYETGEIISKQQEKTTLQPLSYSLEQNYPNPFNPLTRISYQLALNSDVKLTVYDITGRKVINLVNDYQMAGSHTVTFNGSSLASGIYFYRIEAGKFIQVNRMLLIK